MDNHRIIFDLKGQVMIASESDTYSKEITFLSEEFLLKGTLHLPAIDRPPVVIGSHGLFSSSSSPKQIELALKCNASGIAFFRFDHRGCGQSEGAFQEVTSLEARCIDLVSAVKCIQSRSDIGNRLGLFGSSMGGAVCISVASLVAANAMVTFAAPVRSSSILEALEKTNDSNAMHPLFAEKYLRSDLSDKLSNLNHILIFHGDSDNIVPPSNAQEIYSKAGEPKQLIMQRQGDHRMSTKEHQQTFIKEAVNWFKTHL
jgi:alpha-beta hydrolase superfamily lysophospholipase